MICKFKPSHLLFSLDQSLFDIRKLTINLKHMYDKNFLLGVENYFLVMSLYFDKNQQIFVIKYLTQ